MNKLQKWIINSFYILLLPSLLQGMFIPATRGARTYIRGKAAQSIKKPTGPTIQKRGLYTPEQLKQFSSLTKAAKQVSPTYGAAIYASGVLQKMYSVQSNTPKVQLVQELFHEQTGQFKPTALKSKAAYALTPSILGLVMGALNSNKLSDAQIRKDIVDQWQAEYRNITGPKEKISATKINNLLNLIAQAYQEDKNNVNSILLGFLWAKVNPASNHDILHFLNNLNKYIPVFEQGKAIKEYTIPQASPKNEKSSSLMEKFKTTMQNLKNYIYTPEDYTALQKTLKNVTNPEEAIKFATSSEYFEQAIAAIINKTQQSPFYPPQVIQTYHGYKGQLARPNCVESGMQDLFNIILFNITSKAFDLSLLPATIKPSEAFLHFYSLQNEPSKANFPTITQEFMNLVSNVPGISYSSGTYEHKSNVPEMGFSIDNIEPRESSSSTTTSKATSSGGNYELKGKDTEQNLLILANHLLQTNAPDLESLGKALSDQRRTITFTLGSVNEILSDPN